MINKLLFVSTIVVALLSFQAAWATTAAPKTRIQTVTDWTPIQTADSGWGLETRIKEIKVNGRSCFISYTESGYHSGASNSLTCNWNQQ